jgi:hypothetical protein
MSANPVKSRENPENFEGLATCRFKLFVVGFFTSASEHGNALEHAGSIPPVRLLPWPFAIGYRLLQ